MSRSMDLMRLMCVPMPRWIPEHRMQRYTPLEMHTEMSKCAEDTTVNESSQIPGRPPGICRMHEGRRNRTANCAPFRLQSAQSLLSGCFTSSRRTFALRSVVALSGLCIVLDVVKDE